MELRDFNDPIFQLEIVVIALFIIIAALMFWHMKAFERARKEGKPYNSGPFFVMMAMIVCLLIAFGGTTILCIAVESIQR